MVPGCFKDQFKELEFIRDKLKLLKINIVNTDLALYSEAIHLYPIHKSSNFFLQCFSFRGKKCMLFKECFWVYLMSFTVNIVQRRII
jgi:hypothetical protein